MIFVTLGTFPTPFTRPLKALDELCQTGIISEEVIVQSGYTQFKSDYLKMLPFISPQEMEDYIKEARIVITHAGTGSLVQPVKMEKLVIAIPRLFEKNEHVDDHQLEIFNKFVESNYVYPWNKDDRLETILSEIENYTPSKFVSNKIQIVDYLENYIEGL
jgi:UDP-N-acetylglucosamine transferase subunit ALG13